MNRKAFTLIELLVVIVIVGVIMAILMPVLSRAREGARRVQCANNVRQMGIAWHLYLDDNGEAFPSRYNAYPGYTGVKYDMIRTFGGKTGSYSNVPASMRAINRYLDIKDDNSPNVQMFNCPSNRNYVFDTWGSQYAFNTDLCGIRVSQIRTPFSDLFLVRDWWPGSPHGKGRNKNGYLSPRTNVVFMDGHVEMRTLEDVESHP
ncbi:MAG: DUF1559 domain-containing protein [Candidatus Omnitrophica bacterium]|nr:DUF1559 domain-containing protein [Candidatus Omnitrophota bacterium]MBU4487867.1 DUF1559 domain-containing protein [Candidatus Omnitrophota bacterium]MCG2704650.1 DUF1559 domain-containing protein [Candidatus Omnitrophota bacterium]